MNPTAAGANPYAPPKAQVTDVAAEGAAPPIWNPNAAASWSLLFSPAFGAFLQMLNWRALGRQQKADDARGWFIVSLAMLAVYVFIGVLVEPKAADAISRAVGLGYLLVWYFAAGREQAKYVKEKWGKDYPRRGWGKPLLLAVAAFAGYFLVAVGVGIAVGLARA